MGVIKMIKETLGHFRAFVMDKEKISPFILLPLLLFISAVSVTTTVLTMVGLGMSLLYVLQRTSKKNRTVFFFMWTSSSVIVFFLVFEIFLLGMMEVTVNENLIFMMLFSSCVWSLHKTRTIPTKGKDCSVELTAESIHCPTCQVEVKNRYFHSIWLDTCVSAANYNHYMLGLTLADICLLFGAEIGLTSICQPQYMTIFPYLLIPVDCSEAYYELELGFCFAACIYSLCYAACLTVYIIHQAVRQLPKHLRIVAVKKRTDQMVA